MRVERHARQRGYTHKTVLEKQIQLLKSAETSNAKNMKTNSAKAIDALTKVKKENSNLKSELSKALDRCTAEAIQSHQKLHQVGKQVKGYQMLVARLKKRCHRASAVKDKAVQKVRE